MKKFLPLVFSAALLALGACNSETKPVETTAEDNSASGDTAVVIRDDASANPEAMYRMRGRRIADRVYTDLKMTDTTVRTRLSTVYTGRARRLGGLRAKYQTDTTGQYQAMRQAEMETETEMKTIFTDPAQYKTYESHRGDYMDDKYTDEMGTEGQSTTNEVNNDGMSKMDQDAAASSSGDKMDAGSMEGGDKAKLKMKGEDGSKIKMKKGDVKVKDANGEKTKINGD